MKMSVKLAQTSGSIVAKLLKDNWKNLLKIVKECLLSCEEDRCDASTMDDALKDYFLCLQKNGESALNHERRFKVAREAMTTCMGGPIELKKHAQDQIEYLEGGKDSIEELTIVANERLAMFSHLINSDQENAEAHCKLNSQTCLKND